MGYQGIMGYGVDFPLSRLGKAIILWVIGVYGLPEVWVKRVSTVGISSEFTKRSKNGEAKAHPPEMSVAASVTCAINLPERGSCGVGCSV